MVERAADGQIIASVLNFTRSLLERFRSRITGTRVCRMAATGIAEALKEYCDRVDEEIFTLHPGSLFNMGRINAVSYFLSLAMLFFGGIFVYVSMALCLLVVLYDTVHYILCGNLFDWIFKAVKGCNVTGVIEPENEVKQQILIVGHHDSPHIFTFLSRFKKLAGIRMLLAVLSFLYITALSILAAIDVISGSAWRFRGATMTIALVGLVFIIPMYFFISRRSSPGAGDNLNTSSMTIHIAGYFAEQKRQKTPLRHVRLILLSTDGEEAGLKGAASYVAAHKKELTAVPSKVINIDSVYKLKYLTVVTRDRHGTVPLSPDMARECCEVAQELGYSIGAKALPLGCGSTDAAVFAESGIDAVTFVGMPISLTSDDHVYHTEKDTVEAIEPGAVEAVMDIVINYIRHHDACLAESDSTSADNAR